MIARILAWLSPHARACARWQAADMALQAALDRGDTQAIGRARKALQRAATDVLRKEVGL